jgi:hypothetical protein
VLLAQAEANGGPTVYDRDYPPPAWDGYYDSRTLQQQQWSFGNNVQSGTLMQILTSDCQQRFVQALYHVGVSNSPQWMSHALPEFSSDFEAIEICTRDEAGMQRPEVEDDTFEFE